MSAEDYIPSINLQKESKTERGNWGTNDSVNVNSNQPLIPAQISGESQSLTAPGVPLVKRTDQISNLTFLRSSNNFTPENIWRLKDEYR